MATIGAILAAAAVGALICSEVCKGDQVKIKQNIVNKVNISAIAEIMIKEGAITKSGNTIVQSVNWKFEPGCIPPQNASIVQNANIDTKIYNVVTTKISQKLLNKITAEIKNQLTSAVEQVDSKLISALSKNMSAKVSQDVLNEFNNSIKASVTVDTISKVFSSNKISQNATIVCNGPMPTNFTVDQEAQINLAILNMVNTSVSQLAKNQVLLKIFNPLYAKASQKQISGWVMIIIGIVAIIVFLIIIGVIIKKMKSSGQPKALPARETPARVEQSATPRQITTPRRVAPTPTPASRQIRTPSRVAPTPTPRYVRR